MCVGGSLNIVATCLDRHLDGPAASRPAVIFESENGEVRPLPFAELAGSVNRVANALRSLGLGKGDAVGLLMPMSPEIVMALLAVAKIGGVVLPLFSGFGAGAIAERLADGEARLLFTADGMPRRGGLGGPEAVAHEAAGPRAPFIPMVGFR